MRIRTRSIGAVAVAAVLVAVGAGAALGQTTATTTPAPAPGDRVSTGGTTRTVLAVAEPANAAGQVMVLTRVTIAPGARFAEHFHQGTQILRLESGRLRVTFGSGTVVVSRATGTTETVDGPATVVLRRGDSWAETEGIPHSGVNPGRRPAVSVAAVLVADGAGLSTPVGAAAPGSPLDVTTDFTVTENRLVTLPTPGGTRLYGTAVESAAATVAAGGVASGEAVRLTLAENVDYTDGRGPWSGFLTYSFDDGSTIVAAVTGATIATDDGGARFAGTMQVIGGSGRFAGVSGGTGTYTGGRSGALGTTPLPTEVSLRVVGA